MGMQRKFLVICKFLLFLYTFILGCTAAKNLDEKTKIIVNDEQSRSSNLTDSTTSTSAKDFGLDDHLGIMIAPDIRTHPIAVSDDSLTKILILDGESEILSQVFLDSETEMLDSSIVKSPVANKIAENYLKSNNKLPGGHCLAVSKARFEKAYEEIHGHTVYEDLPDSMSTSYYTPREVFDFLYVSASGTHKGWRSLPLKYRGKGNAGAIAFAGMGTLVDWFGIWSGELRPGALMQVWKRKKDYEKVIRGVNSKDFDPFGHSFIFMGYVRDEKREIIGIRIADQGYQSYRPLLPNDYEVWWAVNLTI